MSISAAKRAEVAALRARVLALLADRELYSVEVADAFALGVSGRTLARLKAVLVAMERDGLLTSRHVGCDERDDIRSGNGRRYFSVAQARAVG